MRDELEPDRGAIARDWWLTLDAEERILWVNERIRELGQHCPPPIFANVAAEADDWASMLLDDVLAIYIAAAWRHLAPRRKRAALKVFGKELEVEGGS